MLLKTTWIGKTWNFNSMLCSLLNSSRPCRGQRLGWTRGCGQSSRGVAETDTRSGPQKSTGWRLFNGDSKCQRTNHPNIWMLLHAEHFPPPSVCSQWCLFYRWGHGRVSVPALTRPARSYINGPHQHPLYRLRPVLLSSISLRRFQVQLNLKRCMQSL